MSKDIVPFGETALILDPPAGEIDNSSDAALIREYYDNLGVDSLIRGFALEQPLSEQDATLVEEAHIEEALLAYTFAATGIATQAKTAVPIVTAKGVKADLGLIKGAFTPYYDSMDGALTERVLGPVTGFAKFLGHLGVQAKRPPVARVPRHDGDFWYGTFPAGLTKEVYVKRREGEDEKLYVARHVYHVAVGALSNFSMNARMGSTLHPGNYPKSEHPALTAAQYQALEAGRQARLEG